MFNDNWFLFLLIIMIIFASDGTISRTEGFVMIGILAALTISCACFGLADDDDEEDADRPCGCGRRLA